jgi:hypothetical protein
MDRPIRALLGSLLIVGAARQALAVVGASSDTSKPSQSTSYDIHGGGAGTFAVTESVILDGAAGPWLKSLVNSSGSGISSGSNRGIVETLTNVGAAPWAACHEHVVSRTTVNQPDDAPGFLFHDKSFVLMADYGSGFVPLTQGTDYTLVPTPYINGPAGDFGQWEAIDVFFAPARVIETGDVLKIQKDIFEIFGDGDPWRPGEAAVIAEFPSPEPAGLAIGTWGLSTLLLRRRDKSPAA